MINIKNLLNTCLFIFILTIGCKTIQNETTSRDVEAIKSLVQTFTSIFSSGDTLKFAAFFPGYLDEKAEYMPPGEPKISGTQNILDFFMGYARAFNLDIKFSEEEFFAGGDWGYHRYIYDLQAIPKSGGSAIQERGNGLHVFHRQADRSWKLAKDVWSVPPKKEIQEEISTLKNILLESAEKWNAGDLDGAMHAFDENYLFMNPTMPVHNKKKDLKIEWEKFLRNSHSVYTIESFDGFEFSGDLALIRVSTKEIITPKTGGKGETYNWNELTTARRQPDGNWKLIITCIHK